MSEVRGLKKWALVVILCIFLVACGKPQEIEDPKEIVARQTLELLKSKYNEEFEIESVKYVTQTDSFILFAHPKAEPDVSFRVTKWKMAGDELVDDYIKERRYQQTTKLIKPFADKIAERSLLGANIVSESTRKYSIMQKDMYWDMNYSVLDIIEKYKDNTKLVIRMYYFFDVNDSNREEIAKKVYDLVKYLQDLDVAVVDLDVLFFSEEYFKDKDVKKILREEMGPAGLMNFVSIYSAKYCTFSVNVKGEMPEIKKEITSYKDMEKKMWYKKFLGKKHDFDDREEYEWIQK